MAQISGKPGSANCFAPNQGDNGREADQTKNIMGIMPSVGHNTPNIADKLVNQIREKAGHQQRNSHLPPLLMGEVQTILDGGQGKMSGNMHGLVN
jgi:hypothetical protein